MGNNFINEMNSHGLEVNKITIGEGYNDIKDLLSKNFEKDSSLNKLNGYGGYSDAQVGQYVVKKK